MQKNEWYNFEFVKGAIPPEVLSGMVKASSAICLTGAYSIFLGQVREDVIEGKSVHAIDYTSNEEMATAAFLQIALDAKSQYAVTSLKIIHSLGLVKKGELCLLVLVSCGHRRESFRACEYIVERLKKEVPVWGKELLEDQSHSWKVNN